MCCLLSAGHHETESSALRSIHTTCLSFTRALGILWPGLDSEILGPLKSVVSSRDLKTAKNPARVSNYLIQTQIRKAGHTIILYGN